MKRPVDLYFMTPLNRIRSLKTLRTGIDGRQRPSEYDNKHVCRTHLLSPQCRILLKTSVDCAGDTEQFKCAPFRLANCEYKRKQFPKKKKKTISRPEIFENYRLYYISIISGLSEKRNTRRVPSPELLPKHFSFSLCFVKKKICIFCMHSFTLQFIHFNQSNFIKFNQR